MKDYLTVAKIVKPQGIKGEIKVLALTDTPADLNAFDRVYIGGNAYKVLNVRPQNGECAFVALAGIADRNAAEELRGKTMEVLRSEAPALPDGTYYIADVIGCKVYSEGKEVGVVTDITPARTDVYEVTLLNGGKLVFPAVEGLISEINVSACKVVVDGERLAQVAMEEK